VARIRRRLTLVRGGGISPTPDWLGGASGLGNFPLDVRA